MRPPIARLAPIGMLAASLLIGTGRVAAADTNLECGAFRDYVAPDPGTATSGSITFGLSAAPEAIAATATLVPPADTNLAGLQGGAPTCLSVTRDGGLITSIEFAPSGPISGPVTLVPDLFGSGFDAYVIADRLFVPTDQVAATDWELAIIKAPADAGVPLTITFDIDLTTGVPSAFTAALALTGLVTPGAGDDLMIGSATLPASTIDPVSRALLLAAASQEVLATVAVNAIATISPQGEPSVTITLAVAEDLPGTDDLPDTAMPEPPGSSPLPTLALLMLAVAGVAHRASSPARESARD